MITKKGDGSQVKESTDSSTTIEDDDVKGMSNLIIILYLFEKKNYLINLFGHYCFYVICIVFKCI